MTGALGVLARDPPHRILLLREGAVPAQVQLLLACRDPVVLANACGTVANMALQSDCRTAIMQEEAPQPLISLVESSEEQQVCWITGNTISIRI